MTAVIETVDLTRSFSSGLALDRLTMTVEQGQVLALLGPNGAGKTTTVRLLNGVLKPDGGTARVLGHDTVSEGAALRRRTGVLTETAGLDDRLTARENILFTARIRGVNKSEAHRRSGELLDQFGMGDRTDDLVAGFSTGQRKRVALARALLHDPEVLFLDEPTSGLDPAATRDVAAMITGLATDHGRTIVLATHFLGEAGKLADRMAILHRGRLHAFGSPAQLAAELWPGLRAEFDLGAPADPRVIGLMTAIAGVQIADPTDVGAAIQVDGRDTLPRVVAALVANDVPVYASEPRPPSLEDIYFEVQARADIARTDIARTGIAVPAPTAVRSAAS